MSHGKRYLRARFLVRWVLPLLLAATVLVWRVGSHPSLAESTVVAEKRPAGVFRPSREQWAALNVAEVKTLSFRSIIKTDGNIAFNDEAMTTVFSPYSGRVTRVFAKLGDRVGKGAPLMAVEASEFVQGQYELASSRAVLDNARTTEKRQHELFDVGAGTLKDWHQAQADLVTAEAAWNAARGRLRILGKTDAEIDSLEKSPAWRGEAVVTAPIAGTVVQRQVGVGQYLQSAANGASTPAFTIGDLDTAWLVANLRESDAPALRVGQTAEVSVLALPGKTFKARIAWVGAAVDPVTHRLPVRAVVQNPNGELKPQMFASFSIATSQAVAAPAVPQSALIYEGEAARVFVADADGSLAGRLVRVGRSHQGMVEVLSGLQAGEKIVTSGALFIDRAAESD